MVSAKTAEEVVLRVGHSSPMVHAGPLSVSVPAFTSPAQAKTRWFSCS